MLREGLAQKVENDLEVHAKEGGGGMKLKHCQGCQQLNATIKKAMQSLPAGENFHVVAIIIEQNKELRAARKREQEMFKRLSKICQDNIDAFGDNYKPLTRPDNPHSAPMKGAKCEGRGVCDMAREVLIEIKMIRRENRKKARKG